jgi:hypothetical protein
MVIYEQLLDHNLHWALQEGSMHFDKDNAVHRTLQKIVRKLDDLGVPYAVAGAMALFFHGFRRFTEDVDILVTREGLQKIHAALEGRGYLPLFTGSKNLRDTDLGVRIEFLIAGEYPGDGKPKPVAFPDPAEVRVVADGVSCVNLPRLLEMKLASGMTNPGRMKDLGDAQEIIRVFNLPADFTKELNPFVHDKYLELWKGVQSDTSD